VRWRRVETARRGRYEERESRQHEEMEVRDVQETEG